MSYERAVQARHEFLDSFQILLGVVSVMSGRELERTLARIADRMPGIKVESDRQSAIIVAQTIRLVVGLRGSGSLHESKVKRVWYVTKKKEMRKYLAELERAPDVLSYEAKKRKADLIREKQRSVYELSLEKRRRTLRELSLWDRLFNRPGMPLWPGEPVSYPSPPASLSHYEYEIGNRYDMSELLIEYVSRFRLKHFGLAPEFVNEQNVREVSIKAIEAQA